MTFRPAPGAQVSAGRIRVDAARAIAKLREYQLADRSRWILEAIRAAVASKATAIDLTGDADDVWLAWAGEPWPVEDLPRLFDELVSPEADADRQHLRLLAAGVNSALGMEPAFVDVIAIDGDRATRTRYTPNVLVESTELGDSALRALAAESIAVPPGRKRGMLVHLHRRVSLDVIGRFLQRAEPPEMRCARIECRDIAVPLTIGSSTTLSRATPDHDIVRVPLDEGLDGFLAVIDPDDHGVPGTIELDVAEHGVVLVRYTIPVGGVAPIPLRLFVDAPRMPTNAARSQVRRDAHPIATAEARYPKLVARLVGALLAISEDPVLGKRARVAALRWIASQIAGAEWCFTAAEPHLAPLVKMLLLRDATGAPKPVGFGWNGLVHVGKAPVDEDLAQWVGGIVWMPPGDPARALLGAQEIDRAATRRAIRMARQQRDAHAKFFEHSPRDARVEPRARPRIRARVGAAIADSCIDQRVFAKLSGEVVVYSAAVRDGELVVLLHGREIERVRFDLGFGFDAVIDTEDITPGERYRGARRDEAWRDLEFAMRAMIVRGVEAMLREVPIDGYEVSPATEADAGLVRAAIGLVAELGPPVGELARARVWPTGDGAWASLADLAKLPAIGVVSNDRPAFAIAGRTIVRGTPAERLLLHSLVKVPVVEYAMIDVVDPGTIIDRFLATTVVGLGIAQPGMRGVIWASRSGSMTVHHAGRPLGTVPALGTYLGCTILVDDDSIVPDESWTGARHLGTSGKFVFAIWERAFLRAIALALAGSPPPELHGAGTIDEASSQTRALLEAIATHDPVEMIGEDVVAALRAAPIVRLHGGAGAVSLDAAIKRMPKAPEPLPFVDSTAEPVDGFVALACDEIVARAWGRLAKRETRNVDVLLQSERDRQIRDARLAIHRKQPERELELPTAVGGITIKFDTTLALMMIGAGHESGAIDVAVDVENRPFGTFRVPDPYGLVAHASVKSYRIDESFGAIPDDVREALAKLAAGRVPALVIEFAKRAPEMLGMPGSVGSLCATWLATVGPDSKHAASLRGIAMLPTVQGSRISIEDASDAHGVVQTTTWTGEWLGPETGEAAHSLDRAIVAVGEQTLLPALLERVHPGAVVDVTTDVAKLQSDRRMARGLLPVPQLVDVPPRFKVKLKELGPLGRQLGHGEIGFSPDQRARIFAHDRGVLVGTIELDVLPPVSIAFEAPDLAVDEVVVGADLRALGLTTDDGDEPEHPMTKQVQALAKLLVDKLVSPSLELSDAVRDGLRRASLAGRIEARSLAGIPMFYRCDTSEWVDWGYVHDQIAKQGTMWCVGTLAANPDAMKPLDEARGVILATPLEIATATDNGIRFVDAAPELAIDMRARRNRAKPKVQQLQLPTGEAGLLGSMPLEGDGVTAARGIVGVLLPAATQYAGITVHRGMQPLATHVKDPCKHPTVTVVDDIRYVPDRAWEEPLEEDAWHETIVRVRALSTEILARATDAPADATVKQFIDETRIVGTVWLVHPATAVRLIRLTHQHNEVVTTPSAAPLAGTVLSYVDPHETTSALADACNRAHRALLAKLLQSRATHDPDLVAAHVAIGIQLDRIGIAQSPAVMFPCFAPAPIDAATLRDLFAANTPVPVIVAPDPQRADLALIEDSSALSRVLLDLLRARVVRPRVVDRVPEPAPLVPPPQARMPDAHPLEIVATACHARLAKVGLGKYVVMIERGSSAPLVKFDRAVFIAGKSSQLHAIANALAASSPWADDAIDAIAAHIVTVLNVALTDVTDVTEAGAIRELISR